MATLFNAAWFVLSKEVAVRQHGMTTALAAVAALAVQLPAAGVLAETGRIAVPRFITSDSVPMAVVDALTRVTVNAARAHASTVNTTLDAIVELGFNPMRAIVACAEDVLCLAQAGGTLGVDILVVGRVAVARPGAQEYALQVLSIDVARAVIIRRSAFACSGSATEVEEEFSVHLVGFFDDGAPVLDPVPDAPAAPALREPDAPAVAAGDPASATAAVDSGVVATVPERVTGESAVPVSRDPEVTPPAPYTVLALTGWSGLLFGVASFGIGAWQGAVAYDARRSFVDATTLRDALDAKQRGEEYAVLANGLFTVGAALAMTGAILLLIDRATDDAPSDALHDGTTPPASSALF